MRRTIQVLILALVLSLPLLATAGGNSITVEFDNRDSEWSPRLMLMANPVSDFMVDIRRGIGGKHLQLLSGWNFKVGDHFVISPYAGLGLDDKDDLRPIYAQAEVITFAKAGVFRNVFVASYSLGIQGAPDTLYFQEKAWAQLDEFCIGILTDTVILPLDSGEIAFWRFGPNAGYALSSRILFTVWPNYEFQSETWGVRFGTSIKF